MLVGVHHVAYVVPDMDKAIQFFAKSFDLKLVRREMLENFEMAEFRAGGVKLELMRPLRRESDLGQFLAQTGGGLHHVAYAVEDLNQEVADGLKERGLKTATPGPVVAPTGWKVLNLDVATTLGMRIQLADAAS